MAGDWIKMRTNLDTDPRVIEIASRLGVGELQVVGMLWKVWSWADAHTLDGNAIRVTDVTLDRFALVTGFADALRKVGWLEGRDGLLTFPRFAEHNGQTAKNRAETKERVAKHRNAKTVTDVTPKPLPEKRREEKSIREREEAENQIPFLETRSLAFLQAWERWKRHSSDNDKPIKPMSEEIQLSQIFAAYPSEVEVIAAIDFSIGKNWMNVDLKNSHNIKDTSPVGSNRSKPKTNTDRFAAIVAQQVKA